MSLKTLEHRAWVIAHALIETETEKRGDLLIKVAQELREHGQAFTGTLIDSVGKIYNGHGGE